MLSARGNPLEEVVFSSKYIFTDKNSISLKLNSKKYTIKRKKRAYYVSVETNGKKGLVYLKKTKSIVRAPFKGVLSTLKGVEMYYVNQNSQPQKVQLDLKKRFQSIFIDRSPIITQCPSRDSWQIELNNKDSLSADSIQIIQNNLTNGKNEVSRAIQRVDSLIIDSYGAEEDSIYLGFLRKELEENFCKKELESKLLELEEAQKQLALIFKIKAIEDDNFRSRSGEEQFNILYEGFKNRNILIDLEVGLIYSLSDEKYLTSPSEIMAFSGGVNYCFYFTQNHCLAPLLNFQYSRWFFDAALDDPSEEWRGDYGLSWYFPLLFRPGEATMLMSMKFDFFGVYSENIIHSYKGVSNKEKSYGAASSLILRWSDSPLGYISTINYTATDDFTLNLGVLLSLGVY